VKLELKIWREVSLPFPLKTPKQKKKKKKKEYLKIIFLN
jgi:hypothetical protein